MNDLPPQTFYSVFQTVGLTTFDNLAVDRDQDLLRASNQVKTFPPVMADKLVLVVSILEDPYQRAE